MDEPVYNTVWLCSGTNDPCEFAAAGDHKDASRHFYDPGGNGWSHWLYELRLDGGTWQPTGRSMHTSDSGGYYVDEGGDPSGILEMILLKRIWAAVTRRELEERGPATLQRKFSEILERYGVRDPRLAKALAEVIDQPPEVNPSTRASA